MNQPLSKEELWILSYYRTSELSGALFFGRLARSVKDETLLPFLTEHFAEEASHAWLWTKTIRDLHQTPIVITETYQSHYAREAGLPTTLAEILILTKIFEERIYSHFSKHLEKKEAHPLVKGTLRKMLADEDGHLDWIHKKLDEYKQGGVAVDILESKYRAIDNKIYENVLQYEKNLWEFLEAQDYHESRN